MRLQEEYNRIIQAKNAARKQAEDISAKDHLLCEEIRELYKGREMGGMYHYSLPIQLPPESRALVQELIEICPQKAWKTVSATADASMIGTMPSQEKYWYDTRTQYLQVRLSDGSIHIGKFEFFLEKRTGYVKPAFRLTRQGKEAAEAAAKEAGRRQAVNAIIQEAQRVLTQKIAQNSRITGSREWIALSYTSNIPHLSSIDEDAKETNWIVIFRDGTVYDPYPFNPDQDMRTSFYDRRLAHPGSLEFFRDHCRWQVQRWAAEV